MAQNGGLDLGNIFRVEVADLLDQLSQLLVRQLSEKIDSSGGSGCFFRLQSEVDILTEERWVLLGSGVALVQMRLHVILPHGARRSKNYKLASKELSLVSLQQFCYFDLLAWIKWAWNAFPNGVLLVAVSVVVLLGFSLGHKVMLAAVFVSHPGGQAAVLSLSREEKVALARSVRDRRQWCYYVNEASRLKI